jgi:hypothetical protein
MPIPAPDTTEARVGLALVEFKPLRRNTLVGFATVELKPFGARLQDCPINMTADGTAWASPPGRPRLDRDRNVVRENGKPLYDPTVLFACKADRDRFSSAIVELVRRQHPEAFA